MSTLATINALTMAASMCLALGACQQASDVDPDGSQFQERGAPSGAGDALAREQLSGVLAEGRLLVLGDSYSLSPDFRASLEEELPQVEIVFDSVGGSSLAEQLDRLSQRGDTVGWPLLIMDGGLTDNDPLPEIRDIVDLQEPRCDLWFYVEPVKRRYDRMQVQERRHGQIDRLIDDIDAETPGHTIRWNTALREKAVGTVQDNIDLLEGVIPRSLRRDAVHLNELGYDYLAQIIGQQIRETAPADDC